MSSLQSTILIKKIRKYYLNTFFFHYLIYIFCIYSFSFIFQILLKFLYLFIFPYFLITSERYLILI